MRGQDGDKGTVCVNPTEKQRRKMRKTNNRNPRLKIQLGDKGTVLLSPFS